MELKAAGRRVFICMPKTWAAISLVTLGLVTAVLFTGSGEGVPQPATDIGVCLFLLLTALMFLLPQMIVPDSDGQSLRTGWFWRTQLSTQRVANGSFTLNGGLASIVDSEGEVIWQTATVLGSEGLFGEGQRETTRALLRFARSLVAPAE